MREYVQVTSSLVLNQRNANSQHGEYSKNASQHSVLVIFPITFPFPCLIISLVTPMMMIEYFYGQVVDKEQCGFASVKEMGSTKTTISDIVTGR